MKVAIIGAGLSGLSVCFHLLKQNLSNCEVTLFDMKGIGGGASGVASGLLHPYAALDVRRSLFASEGMKETKFLLSEAQKFSKVALADDSGILRHVSSQEQSKTFDEHIKSFGDVEKQNETLFLVRSGITIYVPLYLEALWKACAALGAKLKLQKIEDVSELKEFDKIVLAAGWGMSAFKECNSLKVEYVKGHKLVFKKSQNGRKSAVGKGYLATTDQVDLFEIGSTYEKKFSSDLPSMNVALENLKPMVDFFECKEEPFNCKAGVRVARIGHYLPFAEKLKNSFVLTAMGSRGLLYHGYFGKLLAELIVNDET